MAIIPSLNTASGQDTFQELYTNYDLVAESLNLITSQNTIATKVIPLGLWDMDATPCVDIAHGLTATQAFTVGVLAISIIDDDQLKINSLGTVKTVTCGGGDGYEYVNATEIRISREDAGIFDSINFNNAAINRGYVYISYIK